MPATQVLAPFTLEKIRNVLSACRVERNAGSYARRLVDSLAEVLDSQHAVWLNWPAVAGCVVAETDGINPLGRWLIRDGCIPLLSNDSTLCEEIRSVAAAPILFRDTVMGVLAVANGDRPYMPADLDVLEAVGRAAVAEYECLERAEVLEMPGRPQALVDLVHDLRQPLGVLEACAFLLETALPAEGRAREQVAEIFLQLDRASGMLDKSTRSYPRVSRPAAGDVNESRVFTNSAMSMVT